MEIDIVFFVFFVLLYITSMVYVYIVYHHLKQPVYF